MTLLAALWRGVGVLIGALAAVTLGGLVIGWVFGDQAARLLAIVLYLVGGFIAIVGLAGGLRGPVRPVGGASMLPQAIRRATRGDVDEMMSSSALLILLGIATCLAAVVIDPHQRLW